MIKIQVIGLPGSGKSTGIQKFLSSKQQLYIEVIDIKKFTGARRARTFRTKVKNHPGPLIAESACGTLVPQTTVILLNPSLETVYHQLKKRGDNIDPDYLSLLATQMITPDHIINTSDELADILKTIFQ